MENQRKRIEAVGRVYDGIPDDQKISGMTYYELSVAFRSCEAGSTGFDVIEREMKKHLAQDQAKINRPNMLWAAGIGGVFALCGVVLGHYLRNDVPPASAVHQVETSDLGIKPPIAKVPQALTTTVAQPPPHPPEVRKDAQPSEANP